MACPPGRVSGCAAPDARRRALPGGRCLVAGQSPALRWCMIARRAGLCPAALSVGKCRIASRRAGLCPAAFCAGKRRIASRRAGLCPAALCAGKCRIASRRAGLCPAALCVGKCRIASRRAGLCPAAVCVGICVVAVAYAWLPGRARHYAHKKGRPLASLSGSRLSAAT